MSLEAAILENTSAINKLIAALANGTSAIVTPLQSVVVATPKVVTETSKTKSVVSEVNTTAATAVSAVTVIPVTTPVAPSATIVEYSAVKKVITDLSNAKGRAAAAALLEQFGALRGPDLKPDQFVDFVAQATAVLAA